MENVPGSVGNLSGMAFVITGATSGIGLQTTKTILDRGAKVMGIGRNQDRLRELEKAHPAFEGWEADLSDEEALERILNRLSHLEELSGIVLNAGITRDALALRMSTAQWGDVIHMNLTVPFRCIQASLRPMMRARFGRIVGISSIVGLSGNAGQANYAASKAGMIGMIKSVAAEVGSRNITANAIAPGFIETPMTAMLEEMYMEKVRERIALKRFGRPSEIAAAVSFLLSKDAGYVTGTVLTVSGGMGY